VFHKLYNLIPFGIEWGEVIAGQISIFIGNVAYGYKPVSLPKRIGRKINEKGGKIMRRKEKMLILAIALTSFWVLFEIPTAHADVTTSGGTLGGFVIHQTDYIHQGKYPVATDFHMKVWEQWDDVNILGWIIKISGFTHATSQRGDQPEPHHSNVEWHFHPVTDADNGRHAIDVVADGVSIPYCTYIKVDITLYLDNYNALWTYDVSWTASPAVKTIPDYGWTIDAPKVLNVTTGDFTHTLTIYNDDVTDTLNVTGLRYLAAPKDIPAIEDLETVNFTSATLNLTIVPGTNSSIDIVTPGDFVGGRIYFTHNLENATGYDIARTYEVHFITWENATAGVGGVIIPLDKVDLLAPFIGLTSAVLGVTAAASVFAKRIKRRKKT